MILNFILLLKYSIKGEVVVLVCVIQGRHVDRSLGRNHKELNRPHCADDC